MSDDTVSATPTTSSPIGLMDTIIGMEPLMLKFKDAVDSVWSKGLKYESTIPPHLYRKANAEAARLRSLGNDEYRTKSYVEALGFYTSSIAVAPTDSEELSLAYGNRSGVHLINEKYDLCLLDVNRALSGQLPESSKVALLKRKQKCLDQLRAANDRKTKLKKAIKNSEKRPLFASERSWLYAHQMSKNETDYKIDFGNFDDPIWNTTFQHPSVPGLSSKVECAHNQEYGRHFVAADNINPGEVISIQEIFALVTPQDTKFQYCSYCTIWCEALIPCLTCAMEMYCSESCRTKAYDLYHRTECKIIASLVYAPDKRNAWLPLRMFLTGTKQGSDLKKIMHDPNVYGILSGKRECAPVQYPTNDYYAILSLSWNMKRKVPTPNQTGKDYLLKQSTTFDFVMHLFELLQHINFFDINHTSENIRSLTDAELFAGLLLLQNVVVSRRYDFIMTVDFFATDPTDFIHTDKKEVARGTGMLRDFMNHSCDANSMYAVNRRNVMIFSARLIKKGEQIFTVIGAYSYKHTPKSVRQMSLEQRFNNNCKCRACTENWAEETILIDRKNKYLTKDKMLIRKIEKYHEWFNVIFDSDDPPYKYKNGDLEKLIRFIKDIRQHVEEPSGTIAACESLIEEFVEKRGNCYVIRKIPSALETFTSNWNLMNKM